MTKFGGISCVSLYAIITLAAMFRSDTLTIPLYTTTSYSGIALYAGMGSMAVMGGTRCPLAKRFRSLHIVDV